MWCTLRMRCVLRGRCSICWILRVRLLALEIGNDLLYVIQITDDIYFLWQAKCLVRLEGDFSWQVEQTVIFGKRIRFEMLYLITKNCLEDRTGRSPKRRARDDDFMVGFWRNRFLLMEVFQGASVQILSGRRSTSKVTCFVLYVWNNVVYFFTKIYFPWQAQCSVKWGGAFPCSTHCKWYVTVVPELYVVVLGSAL